jgi:DNA-binding FadR family transcriptional regulator
MRSTGQTVLAALLAGQRDLEARIHDLEADPRQVLEVGSALLAFAAREDEAFDTLAPLLDPAVEAELSDEHRQFAEDLELLEWLLQTTPDSPDVAMLSASLIPRMRQHIDRDGRLLSQAAVLREGQNGRRRRSPRRP